MKNNWPVKKLGEIVDINPPKSEVSNLAMGTAVSFVSMASINENVGTISNMQTKKLENVKNGYTYFANDDVLFAKITPCMENGKVAIAQNLQNGIGFGTTEVYVLRPTNQVLSEWIYSNVSRDQFRTEAKKHMTGSAGQQRVPKEFLENVKISVPPINYQKKIVERLDAIRKAQELCDQQIQKTEELFKSFLRNELAFNENDKFIRLGDLVGLINGRAFKTKEWSKNGLPIIRIQNLNNLSADFNYYNGNFDKRHLVENGDLLFSWSGSLGTSFGAHIWEREEGLLNQHIFKVNIKSSEMLKMYLYFFLKKITTDIEKKAHGGAGLVHVTKTELEKTRIKDIPLKGQQKIVEKLEAVQNYKKLLLKQKELLKELFDSVLDKSMKGEMDE